MSLKQGAYDTLVNAGITFFDTSDVYGYKSFKEGYSAEQLLGRFAEENVRQLLVLCQCAPCPRTRRLKGWLRVLLLYNDGDRKYFRMART